MAIVLTDDKHYKNIANSIRNSLNTEEVYKPEEMSSKVTDVRIKAYNKGLDDGRTIYYNDGYNAGLKQGEEIGYDAGKQAEYDAFWDAFQQNGKRTIYQSAFSCGWTASLFRPKHKIVPGSSSHQAQRMFFWFGSNNEEPLDWRTVADKIDLSSVTNGSNLFDSARINYIDVDLSNCTTLYSCFAAGWQATGCTHIAVKVSSKCTEYSLFLNGRNTVTHLIFKDGSQIASNINLSDGINLVKDSIVSIINALSSTVSGKTLTLKKSAVNNAFGINVDNQSTWPVGSEYYTLRHSKDNWSISYSG